MVSLIAAVARNGVIGRQNDIPWHLPTDLKFFKQTTEGHAVIMGSKTYESILGSLGKPLPHRRNIVISRNQQYPAHSGVEVVNSLKDALTLAADDDEIFIIGGGQIYSQALPYADRLYITEIKADIDNGEVFFPEFSLHDWREVSRINHAKNQRDEYDFDFVIYERI